MERWWRSLGPGRDCCRYAPELGGCLRGLDFTQRPPQVMSLTNYWTRSSPPVLSREQVNFRLPDEVLERNACPLALLWQIFRVASDLGFPNQVSSDS